MARQRGRPFPVQVDCYAGYRGEQTPRRFRLAEKCIEIAEILDQWLAPEHRYFKLRGADGATYILRQEVESQAWELIFFEGSPQAGTK